MLSPETTQELIQAAVEVWNSYDETGCENSGVVGRAEMKNLVKVLVEAGVLTTFNNPFVQEILAKE